MVSINDSNRASSGANPANGIRARVRAEFSLLSDRQKSNTVRVGNQILSLQEIFDTGLSRLTLPGQIESGKTILEALVNFIEWKGGSDNSRAWNFGNDRTNPVLVFNTEHSRIEPTILSPIDLNADPAAQTIRLEDSPRQNNDEATELATKLVKAWVKVGALSHQTKIKIGEMSESTLADRFQWLYRKFSNPAVFNRYDADTRNNLLSIGRDYAKFLNQYSIKINRGDFSEDLIKYDLERKFRKMDSSGSISELPLNAEPNLRPAPLPPHPSTLDLSELLDANQTNRSAAQRTLVAGDLMSELSAELRSALDTRSGELLLGEEPGQFTSALDSLIALSPQEARLDQTIKAEIEGMQIESTTVRGFLATLVDSLGIPDSGSSSGSSISRMLINDQLQLDRVKAAARKFIIDLNNYVSQSGSRLSGGSIPAVYVADEIQYSTAAGFTLVRSEELISALDNLVQREDRNIGHDVFFADRRTNQLIAFSTIDQVFDYFVGQEDQSGVANFLIALSNRVDELEQRDEHGGHLTARSLGSYFDSNSSLRVFQELPKMSVFEGQIVFEGQEGYSEENKLRFMDRVKYSRLLHRAYLMNPRTSHQTPLDLMLEGDDNEADREELGEAIKFLINRNEASIDQEIIFKDQSFDEEIKFKDLNMLYMTLLHTGIRYDEAGQKTAISKFLIDLGRYIQRKDAQNSLDVHLGLGQEMNIDDLLDDTIINAELLHYRDGVFSIDSEIDEGFIDEIPWNHARLNVPDNGLQAPAQRARMGNFTTALPAQYILGDRHFEPRGSASAGSNGDLSLGNLTYSRANALLSRLRDTNLHQNLIFFDQENERYKEFNPRQTIGDVLDYVADRRDQRDIKAFILAIAYSNQRYGDGIGRDQALLTFDGGDENLHAPRNYVFGIEDNNDYLTKVSNDGMAWLRANLDSDSAHEDDLENTIPPMSREDFLRESNQRGALNIRVSPRSASEEIRSESQRPSIVLRPRGAQPGASRSFAFSPESPSASDSISSSGFVDLHSLAETKREVKKLLNALISFKEPESNERVGQIRAAVENNRISDEDINLTAMEEANLRRAFSNRASSPNRRPFNINHTIVDMSINEFYGNSRQESGNVVNSNYIEGILESFEYRAGYQRELEQARLERNQDLISEKEASIFEIDSLWNPDNGTFNPEQANIIRIIRKITDNLSNKEWRMTGLIEILKRKYSQVAQQSAWRSQRMHLEGGRRVDLNNVRNSFVNYGAHVKINNDANLDGQNALKQLKEIAKTGIGAKAFYESLEEEIYPAMNRYNRPPRNNRSRGAYNVNEGHVLDKLANSLGRDFQRLKISKALFKNIDELKDKRLRRGPSFNELRLDLPVLRDLCESMNVQIILDDVLKEVYRTESTALANVTINNQTIRNSEDFVRVLGDLLESGPVAGQGFGDSIAF